MEVSIMFNPLSTEISANVTGSDSSDGADDADEEFPVEATPPGYDFSIILRTIGNASSTCECCDDVVDGHDLAEWIICDLDMLDFSDESHALICRDCYETKNWKPRVKQNRRDQQINSRLDEAIHWVSRDPVKTLFLRRAAAGTALLLAATAFTTVLTAITAGLGPLWDYLRATNVAIVGTLILLSIAAGYWAHLHEREENDHRGTTVGECNFSDRPWSVLVVTTAGIVVGTGLLLLNPTSTLSILGLTTYIASTAIAFTNLEPAIRADRCHRRVNWIPRYDRELYLLRMSIPVGFALLIGGITIGALVPALAISAYLFERKWYDLGPDWKLLSHGGGSGGGD